MPAGFVNQLLPSGGRYVLRTEGEREQACLVHADWVKRHRLKRDRALGSRRWLSISSRVMRRRLPSGNSTRSMRVTLDIQLPIQAIESQVLYITSVPKDVIADALDVLRSKRHCLLAKWNDRGQILWAGPK